MTEVNIRTRNCDHCKADLTKTDKSYSWHYVLSGEFTPSSSMVGYDPHPQPPIDMHFCDKECLGRWIGATQGDVITSEMWEVGGDVIGATGSFGPNSNYSAQRKLAIEVFKAMWAARGTSAAMGPSAGDEALCEDCPPVGYPTDKTRCSPCPRRETEKPDA